MNLLNPREHSRKGNSIVNSWYTGRSGSRNFVELTMDLFAQFSVSIGVLYASKPRSRY